VTCFCVYTNTGHLEVSDEPMCCPFMMDQGSEMFGFLAGYFESCGVGVATSNVGRSILWGDVVTRS